MSRDHSDAEVAAPVAQTPQSAVCEVSPAIPADPAADVREFMVHAWSELLGCSDLTEHSDFFARGGDALLMTRLIRRIGEEFGVTVAQYDMSRRNLGDQVALVHAVSSKELPWRRRPESGVRQPDVRQFMTHAWGELLGCPDLSGRSDYFALGGDSLLIARLVRRIRMEFGVQVQACDLLAARTLGQQTLVLKSLLVPAQGATRSPRRKAA